MVASYTSNLRVTKQGDDDNPTTWGQVVNAQVIELLEEAVTGVIVIDVTGTTDVNIASTVNNGSSDTARHAVLELTGTLGDNIDLIVPAVEKIYAIRAAWNGNYTVTIKPSGAGSGVDFSIGDKALVYTKGTAIYKLTYALSDLGDAAFLDTIAFANMQDIDESRILGRKSSGTGDIESLTGADANTILPAFTGDTGSGGTKGLVPAPNAGDAAAKKTLCADGTWYSGSSLGTRVYKQTPETAQTWTVPTGVTKVRTIVSGGGGGGHGADGNSGSRGGTGGSSSVTYNSVTATANGGVGGVWSATNQNSVPVSTATGFDFNLPGGGSEGGISGVNGNNAVTNGEPGAYGIKDWTVTPGQNFTYTVGAGGSALSAGVVTAQNGVNGYIIFEY